MGPTGRSRPQFAVAAEQDHPLLIPLRFLLFKKLLLSSRVTASGDAISPFCNS